MPEETGFGVVDAPRITEAEELTWAIWSLIPEWMLSVELIGAVFVVARLELAPGIWTAIAAPVDISVAVDRMGRVEPGENDWTG